MHHEQTRCGSSANACTHAQLHASARAPQAARRYLSPESCLTARESARPSGGLAMARASSRRRGAEPHARARRAAERGAGLAGTARCDGRVALSAHASPRIEGRVGARWTRQLEFIALGRRGLEMLLDFSETLARESLVQWERCPPNVLPGPAAAAKTRPF